MLRFTVSLLDKRSFSIDCAGFWMTDSSLFATPNKFNRTMELIDKEVNNSKEDFILHFKNKYSNAYPPAWMLVEYCQWGS